MATDLDYALLAIDSYSDNASGRLADAGWTPLDGSVDPQLNIPLPEGAAGAGLFARAYQSTTGEIVVAYRGSEGLSDIDDNVDIYIGGAPPQQLYYA